MTQHVYEITLPASIGMQSFVKANDDVRSAMARLCVGGYVELPHAQRSFLVNGSMQRHQVCMYRVVATEEAWNEIGAVIAKNFDGKVPYMVECRPFWTPGATTVSLP